MNPEIETLLKQIDQNLQNPDWLTDTLVKLSQELYWHNTKTAQAQLAEDTETIRLLNSNVPDGKKMAVSEAQTRAVVITQNEYSARKIQAEAIVELLQSLKKKIEYLTFERKQG
jgi:hypothetical protein